MVLKNRHSFTGTAEPRQLIASYFALASHQSERLELIHRID
jgi:hypothetical protein